MKYRGGVMINNADYYAIPKGTLTLNDLIEYKNMPFWLGNIFKACYRFNNKDGNTMLYEVNKIAYYADRGVEIHKAFNKPCWDKEPINVEHFVKHINEELPIGYQLNYSTVAPDLHLYKDTEVILAIHIEHVKTSAVESEQLIMDAVDKPLSAFIGKPIFARGGVVNDNYYPVSTL